MNYNEMSDKEISFLKSLQHNPKRKVRFYTCCCCNSYSIMTRKTKNNPYQDCTTCFGASNPNIENTFLAWPNARGQPIEGGGDDDGKNI